jgi:acyl-CoA thioester hydrolase
MGKTMVLKSEYGHFQDVQTRWMDNDIYGHVNNVVYYSYFDSVVNTYLIEQGGLDIQNGTQIGFIVNSSCVYQQSIAFPDKLVGALRVNRIGNSSVDYGVALFKADADEACAHGVMTHVFVDRETNKPSPIQGKLRQALEAILKS